MRFATGICLNLFHHAKEDTLDRVSLESMERVGRLVLAMLPELQK